MKALVRAFLRKRGFDIVRLRVQDVDGFSDVAARDLQFIREAQAFTMTSMARLVALRDAVDYLVSNNISGDIAECGVWRGGSMMLIAKLLLDRKDTSRTLYLYDTFEGMSAPTDADKTLDGRKAAQLLGENEKGNGKWGHGIWCYASIEDVKNNLESTGYPAEKIRYVKGKVEDTIPKTLPGPLALLRLDTDWYESTKHELEHLFPLVASKGILILDDYGVWQGARKAVDEYFRGKPVFLHRIDEAGRTLAV